MAKSDQDEAQRLRFLQRLPCARKAITLYSYGRTRPLLENLCRSWSDCIRYTQGAVSHYGAGMKSYKYTCVICKTNETISWAERRAEYVCGSCRRIRNRANEAQRRSDDSIKKRLIKQRGNICEICKISPVEDMHHIVEVSMGGTSIDSNLLLVCSICHKDLHRGKATTWQGWKILGGSQ